MSGRVLSTEQAKTSIAKLQSIINQGFTDQITALNNEGQTLSDPSVWDGPLAGDQGGPGQGQAGARAAAQPAPDDRPEHHERRRRRLTHQADPPRHHTTPNPHPHETTQTPRRPPPARHPSGQGEDVGQVQESVHLHPPPSPTI